MPQHRKAGTEGDSPAFYEAVGRAIRRWAELENSLWMLVSSLLHVDQFRARIVVHSMSSGKPTTEFITKLAETYLDTSLLDKYRKLIKRVNDQRLRRNLLAHASMFLGGHNDMLIFNDHFPDETGLAFKAEPITLNEINQLTHALTVLHGEFLSFVMECDGKIHPSARTHREPPVDPTQ
jgi:hypothetical protein